MKMNVARCANVVTGLPIGKQNSCCFFNCFSCINFSFLRTKEGLIKLSEIILGFVCQNLLINSSLTYSLSLGSSYYSFLTTVSAALLTSITLLLSYMLSNKTFQLIRQTIFELVFNGLVSFLYLSSSAYLAFSTYTFLYPVYKLTSIFQSYPTMSATYITGFILGCIHGYDGWLAYKKY